MRWESPEARLNSPLQQIGGLCQGLGQEPKPEAPSPTPQPRMSLPGLLPSYAQKQGEPLCPEQLGAVEIASNGQAGDLGRHPGPAAH